MSYDDTKDATARYWALVNVERAKLGQPPVAPPKPELPPSMQKFLHMPGGSNATQAYIAANQARLDRGEIPIGVNGKPIIRTAAAEPVEESDSNMEAFFRGEVDFEGRVPPGFENVKVKTAKDYQR